MRVVARVMVARVMVARVMVARVMVVPFGRRRVITDVDMRTHRLPVVSTMHLSQGNTLVGQHQENQHQG